MRLEKQVERRNCESPGSPWILDHPDHVDSRSALPSEHRSQTAAAASTPAVRGITLPAGPASSIRQPGMMPEEAPISAQAISTCSLEDASAWEEHVRRCASTMQGPVCVLDINDVNVSDFCQVCDCAVLKTLPYLLSNRKAILSGLESPLLGTGGTPVACRSVARRRILFCCMQRPPHEFPFAIQ